MTKNDYIEKITKNLEHLTKDELKDVAILTNAQFGVRLKVAEKEYWGKEIANLKSQLQQQDLPVVPEEVDKAIKYLKTQNNFATLTDLKKLDILTEKGFSWLNDFQFKDRRFGFGGLNNKLFILSHLAITGYTVEKPQIEKPQLFYLKHIDMSKRNSINDLYLKKYIHAALTGTGEHRLAHAMSAKGTYPSKDYCTFTQQEIDSMQTGSYEQIEVAE